VSNLVTVGVVNQAFAAGLFPPVVVAPADI